MAIKLQNDLVLGTKTAPQAFTSGAVVSVLAELTIPVGTTIETTDIIELAVLPANHRIVDAMIVSVSGFTTEKADVGIMSGDVGSTATGRTSGDEIFDGVALTAFARITAGTAVALAASGKNRSIGVKLDTQTVGAGQKIAFQFLLTQ